MVCGWKDALSRDRLAGPGVKLPFGMACPSLAALFADGSVCISYVVGSTRLLPSPVRVVADVVEEYATLTIAALAGKKYKSMLAVSEVTVGSEVRANVI